jgi:putative sterol carrier protein
MPPLLTSHNGRLFVDIAKLFNTDLATAIAAKPDAAQRVGVKYQFIITGVGGGEWFVDASDTGPKVEQGNSGKADCTIKIGAADFEQLWTNPSSGMNLFFSGRLIVSGDPMLALRLQDLIRTL